MKICFSEPFAPYIQTKFLEYYFWHRSIVKSDKRFVIFNFTYVNKIISSLLYLKLLYGKTRKTINLSKKIGKLNKNKKSTIFVYGYIIKTSSIVVSEYRKAMVLLNHLL